MVKDEKHMMAIVINLASKEGAIKAFDKGKKMAEYIRTKPTEDNGGKAVILFLSSGCDALIQGKPSVKYVRKA